MKSIKIRKIRPQLVITLIFIIVILFEVFLLYTQVYRKLTPEADAVPNENIVRLDITAYNNTIEFLDKLKTFIVEPWDITNLRPF